jgi:hypothetical protein
MKCQLKCIEAYPTATLGADGWALDNIATYVDFIARSRIYCQQIQKLMIHFVSSEDKTITSELSLNLLSIFVPLNAEQELHLKQATDCQSANLLAYGHLQVALRYFQINFCDNPAEMDNIFAEINANLGFFTGQVLSKKSGKITAVLGWTLEKKLEYWLQLTNQNGSEKITITKTTVRYINHKSWFSKMFFEDNNIKINRSKSTDYWLFQNESKEITFHTVKAENEDAHAQFALAKIYLDGVLILPNQTLSNFWLEKAANQSFVQAKRFLEKYKL